MRNEFVWVANDSFPVLSLGFKQALLFQVESPPRASAFILLPAPLLVFFTNNHIAGKFLFMCNTTTGCKDEYCFNKL